MHVLAAVAAVWLATSALVLGAPAGGAAADRVLAEGAASPARSDGKRTAVYFSAPGTLQLLDAGGTPEAAVDVGGGCVEPPSELIAVSETKALFTCAVEHDFEYGRFPSREPRLLDLVTHAVSVPVGAVEAMYGVLSATSGGLFEDVGEHGVLFHWYAYHGNNSRGAIDWRTGARADEPTVPTHLLDLDAPELVATLCDPLRRKPWDVPHEGGSDPPPPFDPFLYEPPYGVSWGPRSPLTLQRCGSSHAQVLERRLPHDQLLQAVALSDGVVSWLGADGARPTSALRAYLPRCGVRVERRAVSSEIAHVRGGLLLSERVNGLWRISRLSLAGICAQTRRAWSLTVRGRRAVVLHARAGATQRLVNRGWHATRIVRLRDRVPRLEARAGSTLRLDPGVAAGAMRWRLGASGGWHRVRAVANGWRLKLPQRLDGPGRLALRVRSRQGGEALFDVRVVPSR
jgi:hypothetical protein